MRIHGAMFWMMLDFVDARSWRLEYFLFWWLRWCWKLFKHIPGAKLLLSLKINDDGSCWCALRRWWSLKLNVVRSCWRTFSVQGIPLEEINIESCSRSFQEHCCIKADIVGSCSSAFRRKYYLMDARSCWRAFEALWLLGDSSWKLKTESIKMNDAIRWPLSKLKSYSFLLDKVEVN